MEISMPAEAASLPDPGDELISRVAGGTDRALFYWSGRESVRELDRTLAIVGRSLDSFASILDFGCGCGRMLLWMDTLGERTALHGTDIDADAIAWCAKHIPYARVTVNNPDPPLPYADGTFDLVFNHSVFTHIDARRQDAWSVSCGASRDPVGSWCSACTARRQSRRTRGRYAIVSSETGSRLSRAASPRTSRYRTGTDFNGILAGASAVNWPQFMDARMWPQLAMEWSNDELPPCKEAAVNAALQSQCRDQNGGRTTTRRALHPEP
jgi:SAM-dependent methyltransferase